LLSIYMKRHLKLLFEDIIRKKIKAKTNSFN